MMKKLWNIRMRGSKKLISPYQPVLNPKEMHISGAEGIYEAEEIHQVVKKYINRAMNHSRGKPDKIVITIEEIKDRPKIISTLPLFTIENSSPIEGEKIARKLLQLAGISGISIYRAFEIIKKDGMRGAAIITSKKGRRLDPNRMRGIRVSRLGITDFALKRLSKRLSAHGINNETVREALVLASKVSSCEEVIAELCISDDPDYTTGYVASKYFGYVRIPKIKDKGNKIGGRAFFVNEKADIKYIIEYLEKRPIMVGEVSLCKGIIPLDEILNYYHI
ncbi:MAG: 6-carboxyhexanoate--CoA ligase [Nitrospirae bacterium]|nr:6-carboxyhexanoate--CoA ligase [Nitrospirota bacterium]